MHSHLNNTSMKTVVETFIVEETKDLIYDNEKLDQWNKHVESLGLTGQTSIKVEKKSPIPFLHMKTHLVNVFTTLCPRKVDVKSYDKGAIPVEILDLVALSVKEEYFNKIEIWYDDETPDPVCVGIKHNSEYDPKYPTWDRGLDKFLIGRWADVKASVEELTEKAKVLFMKKKKSDYETQIRHYQRNLEDLRNEADQNFGFNATDQIDLAF